MLSKNLSLAKQLIKVIAPYMKDANNDILFTIKYIEMKLGRDVYGERLHLPTRFEPTRLSEPSGQMVSTASIGVCSKEVHGQ